MENAKSKAGFPAPFLFGANPGSPCRLMGGLAQITSEWVVSETERLEKLKI